MAELDPAAILTHFSFYREAPLSLQKIILQHAQVATLPAGAFFYREGDSSALIPFVGDGSVRVFKASESGREITLYHVGPGESCILTASCVLTGMRYPASAIVEQGAPVTAVVVPAREFYTWVGEHEQVRRFVFDLMSARLTTMMELVEEVAFGRMDRRLANYLVQQFENNGVALRTISMTHEQIADELGTAREVVSRLLKEFERAGAIEVARGRLRLLNEQGLKKFRDPA
jgi:CRP/FNR family transcriptional regulator